MSAKAVPLRDRILVTKAEAAALCSVGPSTLRTWENEPGFPTFTPPGATRPMIPVPALVAWVEARTERAA